MQKTSVAQRSFAFEKAVLLLDNLILCWFSKQMLQRSIASFHSKKLFGLTFDISHLTLLYHRL